MKKIIGTALIALCSAGLFAYNPPAGSQNILRLSEPQLLAGGTSSAGGALFGVTPGSIAINPALTALEQRVAVDASGTLLISSNDMDKDFTGGKLGSAVGLGLVIPTRWCVATALMQGVFAEFADMPVGDTLNTTFGYAKDINDQLSIGATLHVGLLAGMPGKDWTASLGLGALYNLGDFKSIRDIRFGASILNLGKMYTDFDEYGTTGVSEMKSTDAWPGIATLRFGAAATLLHTKIMDLGTSVDFAFPAFQDFVLDAGAQVMFWKSLKVSLGFELDAKEAANGSTNLIPAVGVSYKFSINTKKSEFMAQKGWEQSELTVSAGIKPMYENIMAVSFGGLINLGLADTQAPEIKVWGEK